MAEEEVYDVTPIRSAKPHQRRFLKLAVVLAIMVIFVLTMAIYFFVIKTDVSVEFVVSPKVIQFDDLYTIGIFVKNHGLSSIHIDSIDITWNRTHDGKIWNSKLDSGSPG